MRTAVMVLLLVLSACGKGGSSTSGGPLSGNQSACEVDGDCTIDCTTGSNCCGPLCRCEVAITRAQAKANRADYERKCEGKELDCPVASCPQPNDTLAAKCKARRCVVEQTPRPTQVDGIYTVAGAPDPRACAVDADCIGDTIPAKDLCCQDPYNVVPHARAWRTWMNDWRTRSCAAAHTCPPPPNPAQPAECGFAVSCKDSRCVNACPP
jgi:hypothetical protein